MFFSFYFFLVPFHLLCLPHFSSSLAAVTQLRGHTCIAGTPLSSQRRQEFSVFSLESAKKTTWAGTPPRVNHNILSLGHYCCCIHKCSQWYILAVTSDRKHFWSKKRPEGLRKVLFQNEVCLPCRSVTTPSPRRPVATFFRRRRGLPTR